MKEHKQEFIITAVGVLFFAAALIINRLISVPFWTELLIFLPSYIIFGLDVLKEAVENIKEGEIFGEEFLMSIATLGAFAIGEYPEAVFVMFFFTVGELFEDLACDSTKKSVKSLMDVRPDTARVFRDGKETEVDARLVNIGEVISVHAGERIPLDGTVIEGNTTLDTVALTGESIPKDITCGEKVYGGCINLTAVIKVRVETEFENSTVSRILDLVENANEKKSNRERFITKFSKIYTPVVVISAVLIAVIPSLITGDFKRYIYSALVFLVVSCPCALVVSVPLSFFCGIGGASKRGILIKNAKALEMLTKVNTVAFDKTGTLTKGTFEVTAIHPNTVNENELLKIAVAAERYCEHPISQSLKNANGGNFADYKTENVCEMAGLGVTADINGKRTLAGNGKLMQKYGIDYKECHKSGTIVHVAQNGEYLGHIVISDTVKENSHKTVNALKAENINCIMLTGDTEKTAQSVANQLGIEDYYAELLPDKKAKIIEDTMLSKGGITAFVGDGINDAPVLATADIGFAMGALGSDAAIDTADIVLMDDNPLSILKALRISKKTLRLVKENIFLSLVVKLGVLIISVIGLKNIMWFAAFADSGVLVLAVLNATRALKIK